MPRVYDAKDAGKVMAAYIGHVIGDRARLLPKFAVLDYVVYNGSIDSERGLKGVVVKEDYVLSSSLIEEYRYSIVLINGHRLSSVREQSLLPFSDAK